MGLSREMIVEHCYLHLPVKNGAEVRWMRFLVGGKLVREFQIELADGKPDFWAFADIRPFQGQRLVVQVDGQAVGAGVLSSLRQADALPDEEGLYREPLRPQFHFSSRCGWNNDPNGLVYYDGEYHLFYQHNPYGIRHGNMHWGHALSADLVHWRELGDALYPDRLGTCFSGSGVVDWRDTARLQAGAEPTLLCIYTSAGGRAPQSEGQPFTQSLAYSNDRGRSWVHFGGNPALGHIAARNRDPKVIWHEPTQSWIMALYLDANEYALYASANLKAWTGLCGVTLPGGRECPDFYPLPVDGDPEDVRWVFWGANGTYLLGQFDGVAYQPEGPIQRYDWGGDSYAAQTWSDIPDEDGRRIQIAWLRGELPGMPFNQCMTFPCELTLRTTPEGIRLCSQPVREIKTLRERTHRWGEETLQPGQNPLAGIGAELLEVDAKFALGDAVEFGLTLRGIRVTYDVAEQQLTCLGRSVPLRAQDGVICLQFLVDRASIEIFGNDGQVALPIGVILDGEETSLEAFARGGRIGINSLEVHELRSAWH